MNTFPVSANDYSAVAICTAVWYALTSGIAFATIAYDKAAAMSRRRRIAERSLHWLSAAGGWPGALLAYRLFHHKTAKQNFRLVFRLTIFVNCLLLACLVLWIAL